VSDPIAALVSDLWEVARMDQAREIADRHLLLAGLRGELQVIGELLARVELGTPPHRWPLVFTEMQAEIRAALAKAGK
jgi:hypothetical protein